MIWIAPSEKDADNAALEKRLWDSADQFRANSGLKAQEYSGPILGIIFLRFAEVRFARQRAKLEKASASSRRGSRVDEPAAYHAEGILYLAPNARFDFLLNLPEAQNIGAKVNDAMRDIEKHHPQNVFPFHVGQGRPTNARGLLHPLPQSGRQLRLADRLFRHGIKFGTAAGSVAALRRGKLCPRANAFTSAIPADGESQCAFPAAHRSRTTSNREEGDIRHRNPTGGSGHFHHHRTMPKSKSSTPPAKNENVKGKKLTKKTARTKAHKAPERRNENKVRGR